MRHLVRILLTNLSSLITLLARFIRNHYREAVDSVRRLGTELTILKTALNLTDDDFPWFIAEERTYLNSLKHPPPQDMVRICYVQVLDDLEEKRYILF